MKYQSNDDSFTAISQTNPTEYKTCDRDGEMMGSIMVGRPEPNSDSRYQKGHLESKKKSTLEVGETYIQTRNN